MLNRFVNLFYALTLLTAVAAFPAMGEEIKIYLTPEEMAEGDLDPGCPAGVDNRSSDLCAQWKAADAAAESAVWTKRTFYLGVAGAVLGGLTLGAAVAAAYYARRAAHAADKSIITTQELGEAQIRAYLCVSEARFKISEKALTVEFLVGNTGQSPSIDTHIEPIIKLGWYNSISMNRDLDLLFDVDVINTTGISVGSGVKILQSHEISQYEFEKAHNLLIQSYFIHDQYGKIGFVLVNVYLRWRDAFGKQSELMVAMVGEVNRHANPFVECEGPLRFVA